MPIVRWLSAITTLAQVLDLYLLSQGAIHRNCMFANIRQQYRKAVKVEDLFCVKKLIPIMNKRMHRDISNKQEENLYIHYVL